MGTDGAGNPRGVSENVDAMSRPSALVISPEAPYPMQGGGAIRTASLLHYLVRDYDLDLILFRQAGDTDPALSLPSALARNVETISPPLLNRFSGQASEIAAVLEGRRYDLGLIEHFWCAPYVEQLEHVCARTILDLHNVESALHLSCAR